MKIDRTGMEKKLDDECGWVATSETGSRGKPRPRAVACGHVIVALLLLVGQIVCDKLCLGGRRSSSALAVIEQCTFCDARDVALLMHQ